MKQTLKTGVMIGLLAWAQASHGKDDWGDVEPPTPPAKPAKKPRPQPDPETQRKLAATQKRLEQSEKEAREAKEELARMKEKENAKPRPPVKEFRDALSAGGSGPTMVEIPAGSFMMGSPASEKGREASEGPQHQVNIASAFALSKTTVTFDEWDACVKGGGCGGNAPKDEGGGKRTRPVINVSWDDAQQYVAWLSKQTGKSYRLPSEAEWEYAARAGTKTAYYWGEAIGKNHANCDGCGSQWDYKQTAPVGSFAPNGFGLHDMAGNVSQWMQDCWHDDYSGKPPTDGSEWVESKCQSNGRVLRGGSWYYNPVFLRAAYRHIGGTAAYRVSGVGLRIARTLP